MNGYGMVSPALLNNAASGYGAYQGSAAPQQISGYASPGMARQKQIHPSIAKWRQQKRDTMLKTMYGADNQKVNMAELTAFLNKHQGKDVSYHALKKFGANLNQISQAGGNQGVYNLQNLQLNAATRGYSNPMQATQPTVPVAQQPTATPPAPRQQPYGILNVYAQRAQKGY